MSLVVETKRLRDLLSFIVDNRGRTCPTAEEGLPPIATNCIKNTSLYPVFEKVRYVDDETYENWFRAHPKPGDLIFVLKGTPGRVCLTPDPVNFCIAQDMVALRADPNEVDPGYLFAALRSPLIQEAIGNLHVGSMIAHFKKGDFDRLEIPVPDRSTQEEIGQIYHLLSQKIEQNEKTAATLEAMARALYRSWFVDFDPVHAKSQGRPPAHMDPATAALFPDSFNDDGLPEGWELRPLLDILELMSGGTPKTSEPDFWDGDIPWASAKDVSQCGQAFLISTERKISTAGLAKSSTKMIPAHSTVVVARGATTGRACMFGSDIAMNQTCYALKSRSGEPFFANCMFMTEVLGITLAAHGSVFDTITTKTLQATSVIAPPAELSARFEDTVSPMFERILELTKENQALATLRDRLLPRLMSGDLRVGAACEQVEDVA